MNVDVHGWDMHGCVRLYALFLRNVFLMSIVFNCLLLPFHWTRTALNLVVSVTMTNKAIHIHIHSFILVGRGRTIPTFSPLGPVWLGRLPSAPCSHVHKNGKIPWTCTVFKHSQYSSIYYIHVPYILPSVLVCLAVLVVPMIREGSLRLQTHVRVLHQSGHRAHCNCQVHCTVNKMWGLK